MKIQIRLLIAFVVAATTAAIPAEFQVNPQGHQFIGFESLDGFTESKGRLATGSILTSPRIATRIKFNELIVSWNAEPAKNLFLTIEAKADYPGRATRYYKMGLWSANTAAHLRESVLNQEDDDGKVLTDVLVLKRRAEGVQIRITVAGTNSGKVMLKFVGLCLSDTTSRPDGIPPNTNSWGRTIAVPERTQMIYPNGKTLCSPTTVSMILAYWSQTLHRPELDQGVPEVAEAVYDSKWPGAGNWPFNTAYAGSFQGMRAYIARLSDISELESWIEQGIPVGLSVDYDRLRAKGPGPNGHIVALVGFTAQGDPVINDPGTSEHVRKTFPRSNLVYAWAASHNTAYLIYPSTVALPKDTCGHWDSATSRN